jgi:hypothetical protein
MQGMTRSLATFGLGLVFGIGLGAALFSLHTSFSSEVPAPAATTTTASAAALPAVATGEFRQADPNDPIHKGAGKVTVREHEVALEADFQVSPGPDFHVLLVPKAAIRASSDLANTMYVDLGALRAFKGAQTYVIPDGVDLSAYPSVVIWSRAYAALISPADLSFVRPGA